jgi:hypothetical protein
VSLPRDAAAIETEASRPAVTELTLTGGGRLRVEGDPQQVEAAILSAARGSIMEFAWMTEAGSGDRVGVNPDHVLLLRVLEAGSDR